MKNKNVMKKMSCLFMAAAMTMSLAACGSAKTQETAGEAATEVAESAETVENTAETGKDASGKVFKVGICNYVDDASLNQIVENMESRLEEAGQELGVTFEVSYDNCNADAAVMNQIIANFEADQVDLMVGVATPVAMAMQAAT